MKKRALIALCALLAQGAAFALPLPHYHKVLETPLGRPDKWDYVYLDREAGRVYIAHETRIDVVDAHSGAIVGRINGIDGAHGIAADDKLGLGFAVNGRRGSVTLFRLATLTKVGSIPADRDSDAVAYDPGRHLLLVANGDAHDASLIDAKTRQRLAQIPLGGSPEGIVLDEAGHAFVNVEGRRELVRISLTRKRVTDRWGIPQCLSPHGLAMDRVAHRLLVSCENGMMVVMNSTNGQVVGSLPIGRGSDTVVFDPGRKWAFSSNRDGTLSIAKEISPGHYGVLGNIATALGARTMAEDRTSGRVFLVTADVAKERKPIGNQPPRLSFIPGTLKLLVYDLAR